MTRKPAASPKPGARPKKSAPPIETISATEYLSLGGAAKPQRRGKYNAIRTVVDGRTFDSKGEAARYGELKLRLRAGEIRDLRCQVKYRLDVNGQHICDYIADFVYVETATGQEVVEDFKGMVTTVFSYKRKMMKAIHGIEILITYAPTRKPARGRTLAAKTEVWTDPDTLPPLAKRKPIRKKIDTDKRSTVK